MVNIKESNYWAIYDFAILKDNSRIQGTKLKALHRLTQTKGEAAKSNDNKINGVNVLHYGKGQYIGFIHTPIKTGQFFPCKLQTIAMTDISK